MKKKLHRISWIFVLLLWLFSETTSYASQATSYTYTHDEKMNYVRTQDAYLPQQTITKLNLNAPEDMFISKEDIMYIADKGNKRIVVYDIQKGDMIHELFYDEFQTPKGVYVTQDGTMYVADSKAKAVFVFDKNYELVNTITRPTVPSFGDTSFEPSKVACDESGNIYIVGEGVYNGVIQMSESGEFLGFFAVNKANLSLLQKIQTLVFTREQLAKMLSRNPTTFANVTLDQRGIVYTVTLGSNKNPIKKHKTNGSNMFADTVYGFPDISDIWVDDQLLIYTSSKRGYIDVYTPDGEWLFEFGSYVSNVDVAGLYTSLSTLAVDQSGYIWTIDGVKGYLQSYAPTQYAVNVYEAIDLYDRGLYEESMNVWNKVLTMNQMSVTAHDGIGKAYMSQYYFKEAMEHFRVAGNHERYSDAFWELRNVWLQKYLKYVLIAIFVIFACSRLVSLLDKEKKVAGKKAKMKEEILSVPLVRDVLYGFHVARHPMDGFYDIRVRKQGSILGASIIYGFLFLGFMLYMIKKGFIYQYADVQDMDINSIVVGFFALIGLFIICNYLVTSINDGEGSLKQVFMVPAYAVIPLMTSFYSVTILSYMVTTNESFFLDVIMLGGSVWTIIALFIGLQTVHNYSGKEMVKSILFTVLFMFIVVVILMTVSIMWEQVWNFLSTIGKELIQNVL